MTSSLDPPRSLSIPNTPTARRARIVGLLATSVVRSQAQLEELLHSSGLDVTQATLSRDLEELGAQKVRDESGSLRYAIQEQPDGSMNWGSVARLTRVARVLGEALVSTESSGNLVVLRTTIATAQYVASVIDLARFDEAIGTIAGDDTVVVITRNASGAEEFATRLLKLAEGQE